MSKSDVSSMVVFENCPGAKMVLICLFALMSFPLTS